MNDFEKFQEVCKHCNPDQIALYGYIMMNPACTEDDMKKDVETYTRDNLGYLMDFCYIEVHQRYDTANNEGHFHV